jgi:uncharacterized membrane protein HdeD (DUF308 family)
MQQDYITEGVDALTKRWGMVVLRGIAGILFGLLMFFAPGISLLTLVFMFGAYALVDGVVNLMVATRAGRNWGWLLFEGVVGLAAGVIAFANPKAAAAALVFVMAFWAVAKGIAEIVAAVRLRRHIRGEWALALTGVLSVGFGVLLFARPAAGALAMLWIIGAYALAFGALLVALGLRLRRARDESHEGQGRELPRHA